MTKINKIRYYHREAMYHLDLAMLNKGLNNVNEQKQNIEKALLFEKKAAYMLINDNNSEPTRFILFRSAANIALQLKDEKEAKRLFKIANRGKNGKKRKDT